MTINNDIAILGDSNFEKFTSEMSMESPVQRMKTRITIHKQKVADDDANDE